MAKVILDANETYTVASASTIFGAAGSNETVKVLDGAAVTFGGDVERVEFAGASTAFTYKATTTGVQVLKGTTVVANVVNNQKLAFTDGSATVSVTFDAATASNVVKVGTQTVTATAAAPTFTPNNAAGEASTLTAGSSSTPTTGQSFSLTTGSDISGTLTGSAGTTATTGPDTFTATNLTYTTGDVLVGGEGADTLTITATAAVGAASTVTGIETINVNSSTVFAASYDATGVVGVGTTVKVANATAGGSFAITKLGTGATVDASGVTGALTVSTTAAASTTVTLAANSASSQSLTIEGTGTADTATISAAGTVALDTDGATPNQVETVNLSGNGAAVTYNVAATPTTINLTGTQNVTVSGDVDLFDTKTLTDNTTAGTTTLKLTADSGTVGGAVGGDLSKTAADVLDIAFASGAATFVVKPSQAIKLSTANTAAVVFDINDNATANVTGSVSVDLAVAANAAGITLDATTSSDNITALTLTNNTVDQSFALTAGTAADVTVSGTKALTLAAASTAKSVTATGLSGVLTVNYDNVSDIATVTGGSGNDAFTNASTAIGTQVTINGGAGNDTFTMMSTAKAVIDGGDGATDKVVLNAATFDATALSLSNVEIIAMDATGATAATFKASQLSGKTYTVTGNATADKIIVGGTAKQIDTTSIDLSKLVFDTTNVTSAEITAAAAGALSDAIAVGTSLTITGASIVDVVDISAMTGGNTISTGLGNDSITAGSGADTITGGEGQDSIVGGAGIDTITLTESTSVQDTVSLTGVTAAANRDSITGFVSGTDKLQLDLDYTTVNTATTVAANTQTSAITQLTAAGAFNLAGLAATTGKDLYILTGGNETTADLSAATNGAELLKYLGTAGNAATGLTTTGESDMFFIAAYDAGNTYVYQVTEGAGTTTAVAADIVLVATLVGTATVAAADFVMIA